MKEWVAEFLIYMPTIIDGGLEHLPEWWQTDLIGGETSSVPESPEKPILTMEEALFAARKGMEFDRRNQLEYQYRVRNINTGKVIML